MPNRINPGTRRWQFIFVLLAALVDLSGRASKREVIQHVKNRRYLNLTPELLKAHKTDSVPIWQNELAQARRDAVDRGLLKPPVERDVWEISEKGLQRLARQEEFFKSGKEEEEIRQLEFLSAAFLDRMGFPKPP